MDRSSKALNDIVVHYINNTQGINVALIVPDASFIRAMATEVLERCDPSATTTRVYACLPTTEWAYEFYPNKVIVVDNCISPTVAQEKYKCESVEQING